MCVCACVCVRACVRACVYCPLKTSLKIFSFCDSVMDNSRVELLKAW